MQGVPFQGRLTPPGYSSKTASRVAHCPVQQRISPIMIISSIYVSWVLELQARGLVSGVGSVFEAGGLDLKQVGLVFK